MLKTFKRILCLNIIPIMSHNVYFATFKLNSMLFGFVFRRNAINIFLFKLRVMAKKNIKIITQINKP